MPTPTLTLVGATSAAGSTGTSFTVVNTGVAIPAGVPLLIGIMGAGSSGTSGVVTNVTDGTNTWVSRHNTGDKDQDGSHHYSLAVYEVASAAAAAAGALTVTVTQTAPVSSGGAGTIAFVGYVSGSSGEDTAATNFNDTNNSTSGNLVSQATASGTLAGDLAIYFGVSYATGGTLTAGSGTTILDSLGGSGGPTVGWLAHGTSATSAGTNTYSVNVAGSASFMASWVTGFKPSGAASPSGNEIVYAYGSN